MNGTLKARIFSVTVEDGKNLKKVWHSEMTDQDNEVVFKSLGSESEANARVELIRYCKQNKIDLPEFLFAYMPPD